MRKFIMTFVAIMLLTQLSACTGRTVYLINDRGHKEKCHVPASSAMKTGVILRDMSIEDCVNQKKRLGYKIINK